MFPVAAAAVALALALAVVACGGGGGSAPVADSPVGQRLATSAAASVGTIADRYTVVNLGYYGWANFGQWYQPINANGQVAYRDWDPQMGYRAMRFDGSTSHDVSPSLATTDWYYELSGINDAGEVFGYGCCAGNQPIMSRDGAAQLAPSGLRCLAGSSASTTRDRQLFTVIKMASRGSGRLQPARW